MLRRDLRDCLDKMNGEKNYSFGEGKNIRIWPKEKKGNYGCIIFGEYISIEAKNQKEIEEKIAGYFTKKQIESQNVANEYEEYALRVKENGLEKTTKNYNLRNKTEVGK